MPKTALMQIARLLMPIALLIALSVACLEPVTAFADGAGDEEAFAVLYESGELVLQHGDTPDPAKGVVLSITGEGEVRTSTPYGGTESYVTLERIPDSLKDSVKKITVNDVIGPYLCLDFFRGFQNLVEVGGPGSIVFGRNQREVFFDCPSLKTVDMSGWDFSGVEGYGVSMGWNIGEIETINVTGMKLPTDANGFFKDLRGLKQLIGVETLDVSHVTDFGEMFRYCSSLKALPISDWDVKNGSNFYGMFYGCSSLEGLDVSTWNMQHVENLGGTPGFKDCNALKNLVLGPNVYVREIPTSTVWVRGSDDKYFSCNELEELYGMQESRNAEYATFRLLERSAQPFALLYDSGDLVFQLGNTEDPSHGSVVKQWEDFENLNYFYSSAMSPDWWASASDIRRVYFNDRIIPRSLYGWFAGCTNLQAVVGLQNLITNRVADFSCLFSGCSSLSRIDLSGFDASNATSMASMFAGCSALKGIDLPP